MRLRRLDLTRYGRFTEHSIDFGAAVPGQPDLHIIYGPNEAGKSTTLSGFLDLLFGIEVQSRYNFRHPYATMRVAARLETAAGPLEIARIKRRHATLLGPGDQPLADGALLGELGGLDRAAYQSMFCLDDESLEAGGKSILDSRGELGQLLFAASSGLAELSQTLTSLRAEADGFYKPNGRGGELSRLKSALAELKSQRDQLDIGAADYHRLVEARDAAKALYEEALAQRTQAQSRKEAIQRQLTALPRLARLTTIRTRLAETAELPEPPAEWAQTLPALQDEAIRLATQAQALAADLHAKSDQLAAIVIDEDAQHLAARVEALAPLQSRFVTAELDIPARQQELETLQAKIDRLLHRLDRTGEAERDSLLIAARPASTLRDLIASRSGIAEAVKVATQEHSEALRLLGQARAALLSAGGKPETQPGAESRIARLATTLAVLRASDHPSRKREAERAREAATGRLSEALLALRPWQGDPASLAGMAVPDAGALAQWQTTLDRVDLLLHTLDTQLAQASGEVSGLQAEVAALGVVSDQQAAAIRGRREAAWAEHRRRLDAASAEAFEAVLREDDLATTARLSHQADAAKAQELARTTAIKQAELQDLSKRRANSLAQRNAVLAEIAARITAGGLGLPAETTPQGLKSWLALRQAALDQSSALQQAGRDLAAAAEDAAALRETLRASLTEAEIAHDPEADLTTLQHLADDAVAAETQLKALRAAVASAVTDESRRAHTLQQAATRDRDWLAHWQSACAACWLGTLDPLPDPAAVSAIFVALAELASLLTSRTDLQSRLQAMAEDQQSFRAKIAAIAGALGLQAEDRAPLDLAQAIAERVQAVRTAIAEQARLGQERETLQAQQRSLALEQENHARRCAAMTDFFGVTSLHEVRELLKQAQDRATLRAQAAEETAELTDLIGPDAEAILAEVSRPTLDAERIALETALEDLDIRTRTAFARSETASDQLRAVGGDDAAARIEGQRRTITLEITQLAETNLRLRAGILAAELALRLYREQHRSAMMARASEAFRTISRGTYTGLSSRPEGASETLIALAADGSSKLADNLSKGTRFQLYLALRAAGFQEFVASHRAVPFVADDIMETFDDFRAEETFKVLADMARHGQVIYLTHHRHLCELVKNCVPEVRIHTLEP